MRGNGCFSHTLNALLLNLSSMYCLRMGRFSTVGGQGKCGWVLGGKFLRGHEHGVSSEDTTPVLVQG